MKRTISNLLFFLLIILISSNASLQELKSPNLWEVFLKNPDERSFRVCKNHIASLKALRKELDLKLTPTKPMTPDEYEKFTKTKEFQDTLKSKEYRDFHTMLYDNFVGYNDGEIFSQFLLLIEKGNKFAMELGFDLDPLLDGGAAESIGIALGMSLKKTPKVFLSLLNQKHPSWFLEKNQDVIGGVTQLIGNYGPEFTDDFVKSLKETRKRISILRTVKEPELIQARDACIRILTAEEEQYKNLIER